MINKTKNLIYSLLKKSQKFTETDNVYIAKYGSYLTVGNILSTAAAFLLSIAFANLLPKETYGQYRYVLSIMGLLAITSLQGINQAVNQAVARGFDGVFLKGFKTKLKWSLLGSLASIGFAGYFWINHNIELTISFLIVAAFLPLFKSGELFKFYLDGKKLFGLRVTYLSIIQIVSIIFMVSALFLTNSLVILILVYFFFYSALRIIFTFISIKKIRPNKSTDPKSITYGKHLSIMSVISLIAQQVDKLLLFHFVGPVQLAVYSFATLPIQHIRNPLQSIQELALPKLSTRSKKEIKKTLPKKLLKATFLILAGIIIYILIAPYFYKILYPQYMDSVFYSRLFAFTLLVFPISMMRLSLQSQMVTKALYKIKIINPIIQIILLLILTPLYGILGVIIATLLHQIFHFFIAWFFFKRM